MQDCGALQAPHSKSKGEGEGPPPVMMMNPLLLVLSRERTARGSQKVRVGITDNIYGIYALSHRPGERGGGDGGVQGDTPPSL